MAEDSELAFPDCTASHGEHRVTDESFDEIVKHVGVDRRSFVRRMLIGTAFAVPVVSSFAMNNLSMNVASAQTNQTSP